jgi:hypothetical protein
VEDIQVVVSSLHLTTYHPWPTLTRLLFSIILARDHMPSKVAFDPEEPSLGCIWADSVAPPHSLISIKRRIQVSRVEETPALVHANLFADISLKELEGHISILGTDGPGLSPDEPLPIVQMPIVQVESPSIPDGRNIENQSEEDYWNAIVDHWDL